MPEQPQCPDRPSLEHLLAGTLPAAEQDAVAQHVEGCPHCQRTLDVLAGTSWSDEVRRLAGDKTAPEPALNQVIDRALSRDATEVTQAGSPTNNDDLSFLGSSSKPGHLGRLGHYEVLELLGKGGFGIVLKAFDEKLHRVVAIKVLSPQVASSGTARKRFTREAQAAAAVAHEHVVTIHAVEDEANPPYLVMQCIDGQSLQEKLDKEGPLGLREILRIGLQTAEGLAAAHKQGLVHRDIKPANILLENGVERVKITDFGLARAIDDSSLTQSGVVAGTPMFMSPEQAEGLTIDHRSDLFSLGTVLYVMCTGRPPFRATGTMAVLKRVIEDIPRPIREINPEIPGWLADIIGKLHAKKPEDRFQTAKEVAEVLGTKLAELQMHGRSGVGHAPSPPAPPRSRRRVVLALAFLLLAGIGAAITFWPRDKSAPSNTEGKQDDKPSPKPVVKTQPFVVLARDGRAEQTYPTLKDAVEKAQSGDTIEVRGDGPFATGAIDLQKKALAIQAGGGFRPHLKFQPTDPNSQEPLLTTDAPLVLEGLTLERGANPEAKDITRTSVLRTRDAPLQIAHCRLIGTKIESGMRVAAAPNFILRNSEILGDSPLGVGFQAWSSCLLSLDNNVIVANAHGFWFVQRSPDLAKAVVRVRRNTIRSTFFPLNFGVGPPLEFLKDGGGKAPGVHLEATGNVLDGETAFYFNPVHDSLPLDKAADLLPKLLAFQDEHNLYSSPNVFLLVNREGAPKAVEPFQTLAEWHKFWGIAKSTSQVGRPVYQGGEFLARALSDPAKVTPADIRLAPGTPGKGKGLDGKDLGADVDSVGPGKPYEEWKKTPDYRAWQKKTDELMGIVSGQVEPFVILAKGGLSEKAFGTLKDAVEKSQSGDTIEVRGDGPYPTEPINLGGRKMTIRAGARYRPVICLGAAFREVKLALISSSTTLVLEGLDLRTDSKAANDPHLITTWGESASLIVQNCRLMGSPDRGFPVNAGPSSSVAVRRSFLIGGPPNSSLGWSPGAGGKLIIEQSVLIGGHGGLLFQFWAVPTEDYSVFLRNSTILGGNWGLRVNWAIVDPKKPEPKASAGAQVDAAGCVIHGGAGLLHFETTKPFSDQDILRVLGPWRWKDGINLLGPTRPFLYAWEREPFPRGKPVRFPEDWKAFWKTDSIPELTGEPKFEGGDLFAQLRDEPLKLQPADFRLADSTPGKGKGEGGKDLGADVDKVGPGKPYEDWKKTPEYQDWQKKTDALMAKPK